MDGDGRRDAAIIGGKFTLDGRTICMVANAGNRRVSL
jgi:hypothetical protein